jgi:hypothetical protein
VNFNSDAGSAATANLRLTISGVGRARFNTTQHLARLTLTNGGNATVNAPLLDTKDLVIQSNGNLDLGTADMIVRAPAGQGQMMLALVSDMIRSARADGAWDGRGLGSGAAASDADRLTTLGIILNEAGGQPIFNTFAGQSVDLDSILIRYTYTGDFDLDRDTDADDYALIDSGFANGLAGYRNGDIDLNGVIDADDYFWIDRAFSGQGAILGAMQTFSASSIPEPGTCAILLTMATILVRRRRRS